MASLWLTRSYRTLHLFVFLIRRPQGLIILRSPHRRQADFILCAPPTTALVADAPANLTVVYVYCQRGLIKMPAAIIRGASAGS